MQVKETFLNDLPESAEDRMEWMAYMGQMYREAEETAVALGWSLGELDEVAEMYLNVSSDAQWTNQTKFDSVMGELFTHSPTATFLSLAEMNKALYGSNIW